jgi:hypothetical protein
MSFDCAGQEVDECRHASTAMDGLDLLEPLLSAPLRVSLAFFLFHMTQVSNLSIQFSDNSLGNGLRLPSAAAQAIPWDGHRVRARHQNTDYTWQPEAKT